MQVNITLTESAQAHVPMVLLKTRAIVLLDVLIICLLILRTKLVSPTVQLGTLNMIDSVSDHVHQECRLMTGCM